MNLLDPLQRLVHDAGRAILEHYGTRVSVAKADASPLTAADRAAHEILTRALPDLAPGIPVVSEEGDPASWSVPPGGAFWLVDPLDGTKEFLKQSGEFTVNVALIRAGRPALGIVHAPARQLTYWADLETGAWHHTPETGAAPIRTRRETPAAPAIVASRDHGGPDERRFIEGFPSATLTSVGSSLKFCLLAQGAADFYPRFGPTMEWDTAAAQCVLEAAGGEVRQLDGQPLRYGKPGFRNPPFLALGNPRWRDPSLSRTPASCSLSTPA